MIKKLFEKMNEKKIQKQNETAYNNLIVGAITPSEEIEIRAFFTRAQR